jgi:hypothetical protein
MILLIGERVHDKSLSSSRVAAWEHRWRQSPLRCIMSTPAMSHGSTRQRLLGIVSIRPGRPFRIVNLLPPDNRSGTWDDGLAELAALDLMVGMSTWNQSDPADPLLGAFLLGRRVMETVVDSRDVDFGDEVDLCGIPALCFPHPSGRSHYLNDDDYRSRAIHWAEKFLRRISK